MTMKKLFILTLFCSNVVSAQSLLIAQNSQVTPAPFKAKPTPPKVTPIQQAQIRVPKQLTIPNTTKAPGTTKTPGRIDFVPAQNGIKLHGGVGNIHNVTQQHMMTGQDQGLSQRQGISPHKGVPFSNHYSDVAGNSSRQIKSGSGFGASHQSSREYNKAMNKLERNVNGVIANPANDRRNTVFGAGIDFE